MELYDVYNNKRQKLNYTKERGQVMDENEYNFGVEAWITCENKILMTRRCEFKSHPLMWEAPGGCSQAGEESIDSLLRELSEETSIKVSEDNYKLIGTILYKKQFVDIYTADLNINLAELRIQEEEVSDIKLIDEKTFKEMENDKKIVESVLNRFYKIKEYLNINW